MAGPTLSADEIAQLKKEKAKAESQAATFTGQIAAQQARAQELAKTDSAFKKFFDYYNDSIIGKYDAERKALNGQYISSPVSESDILACASLLGGRIQPTLPVTDIIRIPEFDGGPLVTDPANESQHITDQTSTENVLVSGYSGGPYANTIKTNSILTPTSTTLQLKDISNTFSIAPNSVFIILDGTNFAAVRVVGFTLQPSSPPYVADLTIQLLIPPTSNIATDQILQSFSGFSDTERANKIANTSGFQPVLNYLVDQLNQIINLRINRLNEQLSALGGNQDPDGLSEIAVATTNVNNSKSTLQVYLSAMDVSDAGINNLASERTLRISQIASRVTQITNAYTSRTENYYNQRYQVANDRANTSRGTLRLQKAAEANASQSQSFASSLQAQAEAFNKILP